MEPPVWVCQKLAEVDPNARLGFDGRFWCLVKLYRGRDLETKFLAEPDYWNNRGPIFSKRGRRNIDWDCLGRIPCSVSSFSNHSIETGNCIAQFKSWTADVRDTIRDDLIQQSKEYETLLQDHAEEMTDYASWHVRHGWKVGEVGPSDTTAKKFVQRESDEVKEAKRINRYDAELMNLEYAWRSQGWVPKEERGGASLSI